MLDVVAGTFAAFLQRPGGAGWAVHQSTGISADGADGPVVIHRATVEEPALATSGDVCPHVVAPAHDAFPDEGGFTDDEAPFPSPSQGELGLR